MTNGGVAGDGPTIGRFGHLDGTADAAELLAARIRDGLAAAADPQRAPEMQRYMKSDMPFRGVAAPVGRALYRDAVRDFPLSTRAECEVAVRLLYDRASFREERYGALHVLRARPYARFLDGEAMPLLAHIIATGAWWDLVDEASTAVGEALRRDPERVAPILIEWADGPDMWLARAAIICQRSFRGATDTEVLARVIRPSIGNREFFLGKGIGWALREFSKTDSEWVRAFVTAEQGLTALSRREALKWLVSRGS